LNFAGLFDRLHERELKWVLGKMPQLEILDASLPRGCSFVSFLGYPEALNGICLLVSNCSGLTTLRLAGYIPLEAQELQTLPRVLDIMYT